ncbi:DUF6086 family protein [Nocardia sp. NPDC057668]|uniref:DUF6086 family protein n=1 Tax=Nocardia sp. NPDC057668 TaxID=3346202 RepID=UPI00366EC5C0
MSMYFQMGDRDLWNPGNRSGAMFVSLAEAMSPIVEKPTGLRAQEFDPGTIDVDIEQFRAFTVALADAYGTTQNMVYRRMVETILAICLVITERAGVSVEIETRGPSGLGDRVAELTRAMAR